MFAFRKALYATTCFVLASGSTAAFAMDKPAPGPDQPSPAVAASKMSATVEFSLATLDRELERKIPRRLASFSDHGSSCWHRRILGRNVNIDCAYSGSVERVAPVSLRAEGGRLVAAAPLFGSVSGQGIGRFARLLHGSAEGQLMVYASARPRLQSDWSISLDMSEGFRWQQPPILQILGFRIDMARYVEPSIRNQLGRVRGDVEASVRDLGIKGKAEAAWRNAFANVRIVDTPEIWLQTTPQTIAFSGLRAEGDVLEGSIEIGGNTSTTIGAEPAQPAPTPLPKLGSDVTNPGHFEIIVPVTFNYDALRAKVQDVIAAHAELGLAAQDIQIYPSAGKLVIGVRIGQTTGSSAQGNGDWIYLTATPQADANAQAVQFPDLALSADANTTAELQSAFGAGGNMLGALKDQLRVGYQAERDRIIASANAKLTRPVGDGFRSEGHLTSAGVANIELLANSIRVNFRAEGRLNLRYGS